MKLNETLYNEFYSYVNKSLQATLNETIKTITNHSNFKFGNDRDKLEVLDNLKIDFRGDGHFNYLQAKGVSYKNGKFEIVKSEFDEVIETCGVNLETTEFGVFQNENDKLKSFAYKSFHQATCILNYCLELQIIKEFEQAIDGKEFSKKDNQLEFSTHSNKTPHPIFKDVHYSNLIEYCINEYSENYQVNRVFASVLYQVFRGDMKKQNQKLFAEYWNENFSHFYKLKIDKKHSGLDSFEENNTRHKEIELIINELLDYKV
ncbi:hypothetical protein [Christiangramia sp. SM2212]|uniref:Uncharacterized protein n=1 Tax=Christiangramia sediminicola TaxID=3073267 RepID=A0ABU1ETA2_9FLAO|nr:hypothetical protein [Christiangramia sp. SM2212]MDR5591204.1 hypothetical protein [Christiangramia sp. SM2212]